LSLIYGAAVKHLSRKKSLVNGDSDRGNVRRGSFWKQFPGLVWSNSKASDKKEHLEAVGREFGMKRLRREWSILRADKITPLSPKHISLVLALLDQTEGNLIGPSAVRFNRVFLPRYGRITRS
jgi:hypothetical protein